MSPTIDLLQAEENRKPLPAAKVGSFVRSTSNDLGTGKIVGVEGNTVEIEYFDSVGQDGRFRYRVTRDTVRRVHIPCQTRCWFEPDGIWQTGRVVELLDHRYSIFLPNQKLAILAEPDFYVRWNRPVRDPMDVMIANAFDTPLFHEVRRPFIDGLLMQRAACQGMTTLSSSVIELYPHQLDVVARVLVDDRQRYVLADEVGLGKTIEAGMIVRQWLLDQPGLSVVVAVPKFLVQQWRDELAIKFQVAELGAHAVRVIPHSSLPELLGEPPRFLIVDEAHVLMPSSNDRDEVQLYEALEAAAGQATGGLLLLTATPLLHNEAAFLAMLHLLDPEVYDLGELDSFKQKVRDRQALALRVNGLQPTAPEFLLDRHIDYLLSQYPADPVLSALARDVREDLGAGRSAGYARKIQALREHVHETYRLYRRVLRNRRASERTRTFQVRGRTGVEPTVVPEESRIALNDWLDEWRLQLASDHGVTHETSELLRLLLECSGSDLNVMREALTVRLGEARPANGYLAPAHATVLKRLPPTVAETRLLERGAAISVGADASESRIRQVVELLGDMPSREKAVVFTEFTGVATRLAAEIAAAYGSGCVALHLADMPADSVEAEVQRFRSQTTCHYLVCDPSAETGRNLQWADRIVHLDLPWSPNRVEQRVGRLDRYANAPEVRSTVFADGSPGSFADAWLDCLSTGFGVFSRSIASLQHPIEDAMKNLGLAMLSDGLLALVEATTSLPTRLERELENVESLEALEAISDEGVFRRDLYDLVTSSEKQWPVRQRATENWIADKPGNLRFYKELGPRELRRYLTHPPNRNPKAENMPLVPWDVLTDVFVPLLDRPSTFSREIAIQNPGVHLLGGGDPFIDALTLYSRWDTRGQAFAMWRRRRAWLNEPEFVAFRLDFIASASIDPALKVLGGTFSAERDTALRRLCEPFFPPVVHTVWIDTQGNEIEDDSVMRVLQQPYDTSRGDAHLSPSRRWALDSLLPVGWAELCARLRSRGENLARDSSALVKASEAAVERADRALGIMLSRRSLRKSAFSEDAQAEELSWLDESLVSAVARGLREPNLALDAVGCVVIAGSFPDGWYDQ
jgi:ATP-dependent helicase HepA